MLTLKRSEKKRKSKSASQSNSTHDLAALHSPLPLVLILPPLLASPSLPSSLCSPRGQASRTFSSAKGRSHVWGILRHYARLSISKHTRFTFLSSPSRLSFLFISLKSTYCSLLHFTNTALFTLSFYLTITNALILTSY